MKPTGVDRFYYDAAYIAALLIFLIENKSDHETDAEIGSILTDKPFMTLVVLDVLKNYSTAKAAEELESW